MSETLLHTEHFTAKEQRQGAAVTHESTTQVQTPRTTGLEHSTQLSQKVTIPLTGDTDMGHARFLYQALPAWLPGHHHHRPVGKLSAAEHRPHPKDQGELRRVSSVITSCTVLLSSLRR